MKTALLRRLKHLEEVRAVGSQPPLEFQIGYIKKLPEEYTGERHVVTVRRHTDGTYRWEERPGASPASEDSPKWIIRSILVGGEGWTARLLLARGCAAMKTVERRLDRLEDRLAPQSRKQFLLILTDARQSLTLDSGRCVQILREAGHLGHERFRPPRGLREHT